MSTQEALRGPWVAVLADRYGWLIPEPDLDDYDPNEVTAQIVRRTAAPEPDGEEQRLPGIHASEDHLIEFGDFEDLDEARARWVQVQAMVAGLNAAATANEATGADQ